MKYGRPMRSALFALVLLAGCGETRLVVAMVAENNSGQSGTATLEERGKGLSVELVLKPIDEPGNQLVHFHKGQCGEISGPQILFPNTERPIALVPLTARDDGQVGSSNLLEGSKLEHFTDGTWVINVHDPRDRSLYTSCGNIR
jgi:CHRD domain